MEISTTRLVIIGVFIVSAVFYILYNRNILLNNNSISLNNVFKDRKVNGSAARMTVLLLGLSIGVLLNKFILKDYFSIYTVAIISPLLSGFLWLQFGVQLFYPASFLCPFCPQAIMFYSDWKCQNCGHINQERLISAECKKCKNKLTSIKCPNCKGDIKFNKEYKCTE